MPSTWKILILVWIIGFAGAIQPDKERTENFSKLIINPNQRKNQEPTKIELRNLTLTHRHNDTEILQEAIKTIVSSFSLNGSLLNNVENDGGIQNAVIINNVHYNFYFWLLPKNYSVAELRKRRSIMSKN